MTKHKKKNTKKKKRRFNIVMLGQFRTLAMFHMCKHQPWFKPSKSQLYHSGSVSREVSTLLQNYTAVQVEVAKDDVRGNINLKEETSNIQGAA